LKEERDLWKILILEITQHYLGSSIYEVNNDILAQLQIESYDRIKLHNTLDLIYRDQNMTKIVNFISKLLHKNDNIE